MLRLFAQPLSKALVDSLHLPTKFEPPVFLVLSNNCFEAIWVIASELFKEMVDSKAALLLQC